MAFQDLLEQNDFILSWRNEEGSLMKLSYGNDGALSGTYQSGVGEKQLFQLSGRWDTTKSKNSSYACGWSVVWSTSSGIDLDEVTSWSGHHILDNSRYIIKTTWLLTKDTVLTNDWKSTLIGQDTFTLVD